jgi:hypothetical protein
MPMSSTSVGVTTTSPRGSHDARVLRRSMRMVSRHTPVSDPYVMRAMRSRVPTCRKPTVSWSARLGVQQGPADALTARGRSDVDGVLDDAPVDLPTGGRGHGDPAEDLVAVDGN